MKNKTINLKIMLISLGIIIALLWFYLFATIPNMLVEDMSKLEKLGILWMIIMPFISAGLIIAGLILSDANVLDAETEDKK